jgi:hypothetical protein
MGEVRSDLIPSNGPSWTKRKAKPPRPRSFRCWAIMDTATRSIVTVYPRQFGKREVMGECFDGQIAVRVRVIPE